MTRPARTWMGRVHAALVRVGRGALWVWAPATIVLVGVVMMSHVLALPTPAVESLELALARSSGPSGVWRAVHVLYAACPCSRQVAETLLSRAPRADFREEVLFVGEDAALGSRLRAAGFSVRELTPEELDAELGLVAAPAFFAVTPDGKVPYLGGYSDYKRGPSRDVAILSRVRAGERPAALPVFGCAVSRELSARADPFGLSAVAREEAR